MNDKKGIEAKSFNIGFVAVCGFGIGIFFGTILGLTVSRLLFGDDTSADIYLTAGFGGMLGALLLNGAWKIHLGKQ